MRILLVSSSSLDEGGRPVKYRKGIIPPLSLAVLAGLTPPEHDVFVVNDSVETIDFSPGYDLAGITAMTCQAERAYMISAGLRKRGVPVVIGGIHATIMPEEAKRHCDAVVVGEAERVWPDVLMDAERKNLKEFYMGGQIPDLSESPVPDWSAMNLGIYPRIPGSRFPIMPVFTTRGCPYGCRFCIVTKLHGGSYRCKPVSSVLREIKHTGAGEFFFVDDNIACEPAYSRELFSSLRGENVGWMAQMSATVLKNPDLIERAADAGCRCLFVGMESVNQSSLKNAGKNFNRVEQYSELIRRMRKAGIMLFASFMFGFDEDTDDQFQLTLEFLRRERVGLAAFWLLTPIPGTEIHAEMASAGRINGHGWSAYDGTRAVFRPANIDAEELTRRYWEAFRRYYSLPGILRNAFWNVTCSRNKFEELQRSLFFQPHFMLKVRQKDHPFSGGFARL